VSQEDQALAERLAEESLAHFREQDNTLYSAAPLSLLGLIRLAQGELEVARALLEESLAIDKQFGTETEDIHLALGRLFALQGDVEAARDQYQQSLTFLLESNVSKEYVAASLEGLAVLEAKQGAPRHAARLWGTTAALREAIDVAASLEGLAALEAKQGAPRHAARLWGSAEALREAIGAPIYPVYQASYEQATAQACAMLGEQAFRMAWAEGRNMTPEQVLAVQEPATIPTAGPSVPQSPVPTPSPTYPAGLTAREVEVLRLLAQGWSDVQIAEHLVISPRTVNRHTTSLYSKLNVSSRAAATRFALEHHLL